MVDFWIYDFIFLPSSNTSQHWNGSNPIHIKQEIQIPQVSTIEHVFQFFVENIDAMLTNHIVRSPPSPPRQTAPQVQA